MIKQLQHLGLSDKEASVYMASLELGSDTVQEIAKRAEIKRANTYAVIEKLMGKGLMSSVEKGKKTHQEVISPYRNKVIELHSFREIDNFVDSL